MGKELKIELSENMGVGDDDKQPRKPQGIGGAILEWIEGLWTTKKNSSSG